MITVMIISVGYPYSQKASKLIPSGFPPVFHSAGCRCSSHSPCVRQEPRPLLVPSASLLLISIVKKNAGRRMRGFPSMPNAAPAPSPRSHDLYPGHYLRRFDWIINDSTISHTFWAPLQIAYERRFLRQDSHSTRRHGRSGSPAFASRSGYFTSPQSYLPLPSLLPEKASQPTRSAAI